MPNILPKFLHTRKKPPMQGRVCNQTKKREGLNREEVSHRVIFDEAFFTCNTEKEKSLSAHGLSKRAGLSHV